MADLAGVMYTLANARNDLAKMRAGFARCKAAMKMNLLLRAQLSQEIKNIGDEEMVKLQARSQEPGFIFQIEMERLHARVQERMVATIQEDIRVSDIGESLLRQQYALEKKYSEYELKIKLMETADLDDAAGPKFRSPPGRMRAASWSPQRSQPRTEAASSTSSSAAAEQLPVVLMAPDEKSQPSLSHADLADLRKAEEEMIQKAIQESLKDTQSQNTASSSADTPTSGAGCQDLVVYQGPMLQQVEGLPASPLYTTEAEMVRQAIQESLRVTPRNAAAAAAASSTSGFGFTAASTPATNATDSGGGNASSALSPPRDMSDHKEFSPPKKLTNVENPTDDDDSSRQSIQDLVDAIPHSRTRSRRRALGIPPITIPPTIVVPVADEAAQLAESVVREEEEAMVRRAIEESLKEAHRVGAANSSSPAPAAQSESAEEKVQEEPTATEGENTEETGEPQIPCE